MILQTWSRNVLVEKCPLVEKCRSGNVLRSRSVSVKKWGSRNVGRKMSGRDLSLHVQASTPGGRVIPNQQRVDLGLTTKKNPGKWKISDKNREEKVKQAHRAQLGSTINKAAV